MTAIDRAAGRVAVVESKTYELGAPATCPRATTLVDPVQRLNTAIRQTTCSPL
jgi:hypothetical protein